MQAPCCERQADVVDVRLGVGADRIAWQTRGGRVQVISTNGGRWAVPGTLPRWSDDGQRLAVVDPRGAAIILRGPEGRGTLTTLVLDSHRAERVVAMEWSPDGSRIAALMQDPAHALRLLTVEPQRGGQVRVQATDIASPVVTWTGDGHPAYLACVGAGRTRPRTAMDPRWLGPPGGWRGLGVIAAEVFLLGRPDPVDLKGRGCGLYLVGTDLLELVGPDHDVQERPGIIVSAGTRGRAGVTVVVAERGGYGVMRVRSDGRVRRLRLPRVLVPTAVDAREGVVAACGHSRRRTGDAVVVGGSGLAPPMPVTRPGHRVAAVTVRRDGMALDAWVHLPSGSGRISTVVLLHGGPRGQSGPWRTADIDHLVTAGFGVVAPNPRGSSGRGAAFAHSVVDGGMGVVDVADVVVLLDAAWEAVPRLRTDRFGVSGHSYGSVVACGLAAVDGRVASLVLDRPIGCWSAFRRCGRDGTAFCAAYFPAWADGPFSPDGPCPPSCPAHGAAGRIEAPVLIVEAGADRICPPAQLQPLRDRLARSTTCTVRDAAHSLPDDGSMRDRAARTHSIISWHRRHLTAPTTSHKDPA